MKVESLFENSKGSCFRGKDRMAKRDEGACLPAICDRGTGSKIGSTARLAWRLSFSLMIWLSLGDLCPSYSANGSRLLVIAHRGGVVDEDHPENSLSGLEEAIKRGYTHVEVDARVTKDGHVVCFHDANLKNATGVDKNVSDLDLAEIKSLRLNRSGEAIPTFEEFCRRCAGRVELMVDIKGADDEVIESYAREIERSLVRHGLIDHALILINRIPIHNQEKIADWFFGKAGISWRDPLMQARKRLRAKNDPSEFFYIFNHGEDFDREQVDGFHAMGLKVIVSINTGHYKEGDPVQLGFADLRRVVALGVDGVQIDSCYDSVVFTSNGNSR